MHISERRPSNAKSIKAHAARIDHAAGGCKHAESRLILTGTGRQRQVMIGLALRCTVYMVAIMRFEEPGILDIIVFILERSFQLEQ